MIDTQAIRSKILDLAMRGQLTEQFPEGTGYRAAAAANDRQRGKQNGKYLLMHIKDSFRKIPFIVSESSSEKGQKTSQGKEQNGQEIYPLPLTVQFISNTVLQLRSVLRLCGQGSCGQAL